MSLILKKKIIIFGNYFAKPLNLFYYYFELKKIKSRFTFIYRKSRVIHHKLRGKFLEQMLFRYVNSWADTPTSKVVFLVGIDRIVLRLFPTYLGYYELNCKKKYNTHEYIKFSWRNNTCRIIFLYLVSDLFIAFRIRKVAHCMT